MVTMARRRSLVTVSDFLTAGLAIGGQDVGRSSHGLCEALMAQAEAREHLSLAPPGDRNLVVP